MTKTLNFNFVDEDFGTDFKEGLVFTIKNKDIFKVITPKRMEIINYLSYHGDAYINELAKGLKRKKQAISRDVQVLLKSGIIKRYKCGKLSWLYLVYAHIQIKLREPKKYNTMPNKDVGAANGASIISFA